MEVRWTVHIPQAMQQHGGSIKPRRPEGTEPIKALPVAAGETERSQRAVEETE